MQSKSSSPKALVNIGIIMIVIGLVMGIIAGVMIFNYNKKKQTYIQTTSIVVEYLTKLQEMDGSEPIHPNGDEIEVYAPIVEYEVDGKKYKATYKTYMDNPPEIGSEMSIRYNKNNPTEVIFDKDRNNIGIPIIAGVFVVFGLFAFILGKVKAKKESEVW